MNQEIVFSHLSNSPNNIIASALSKLGYTIEDCMHLLFNYTFKKSDNNIYKGKYVFQLEKYIFIMYDLSKLSGIIIPRCCDKSGEVYSFIINSGNFSWNGENLSNDNIFYISIVENNKHEYNYNYLIDSGLNFKQITDEDLDFYQSIRYVKDIEMEKFSDILKKNIRLDEKILFTEFKSFISTEIVDEIFLNFDINITNYFKKQ